MQKRKVLPTRDKETPYGFPRSRGKRRAKKYSCFQATSRDSARGTSTRRSSSRAQLLAVGRLCNVLTSSKKTGGEEAGRLVAHKMTKKSCWLKWHQEWVHVGKNWVWIFKNFQFCHELNEIFCFNNSFQKPNIRSLFFCD